MQRVATVDKCFDILEAILSAGPDGVGIREMARLQKINPTTVHNLCWTLCARGYLRQDPSTKRFHLGAGLLPFAQSMQVWQSLAETVEPLVRDCREELDESILLAVMDHLEIATLIYMPSTQALRVHEPRVLGDLAYGTAVGKTLLSTLSKDALTQYFEQFPPRAYDSESEIDPNDIRTELTSIRQQGYAVSSDELADGVSAVAIPICGPTGDAMAALGASAPTVRMNGSKAKHIRQTLTRYGEAIAKEWFKVSE